MTEKYEDVRVRVRGSGQRRGEVSAWTLPSKKIRLPHNVTHHHSHEKSCSNSQ